MAQDVYRLGPGDTVRLRIVSWDAVERAFVEYSALNGEYAVGTDGTVTVPLLGPLQALEKSTGELAREVSVQFQARLGLLDPPSASIEIASFRPVYVIGAVAQAGPHEFSPGLTVMQAIALAGGVDAVLQEGADGLAATIRAAGTLREISLGMARQKIRAARLRAEMNGEADFAAPAIADYPGGAAAVEALTDQERSLFLSRRDAQERALEALEGSRVLLETEIAALEEKLVGQTRQVELLSESVGNMESLVERGLARSPNFIALQRQLIDLESRALDTETAAFRARQELAELERDRVEIEAARRLEVLRELQRAEAEIDRLAVQRDTTRQLLVGAEASLADDDETPGLELRYRITRAGPSGQTVLQAGPETRLKPSDVLDVEALPVEEGS